MSVSYYIHFQKSNSVQQLKTAEVHWIMCHFSDSFKICLSVEILAVVQVLLDQSLDL